MRGAQTIAELETALAAECGRQKGKPAVSAVRHEVIRCVRCKVNRAALDFNRDPSRLSGRRTECKFCSREINRSYYKPKPAAPRPPDFGPLLDCLGRRR